MANLAPARRERAVMLEFDINGRPLDVVEAILKHGPRIVGIGVYIWNAEPATKVVAELKRLRPDITIVVGGPEVSYETDQQEICRLADFVITGEADLAFDELCAKLLSGQRPLMKVIPAELPEFGEVATKRRSDEATRALAVEGEAQPSSAARAVALPYSLYTDKDLAHRIVYVEASRGCPFKCEFCLSSLDVPVRNVPLDSFLGEMQSLLDRGLRMFKFVDRTFNLNLNFSKSILQFFLDRYVDGLFLHFEMIPDRLPDALRTLIAAFPAGALQFEVGIQTFNEAVSARISRRQENAKVAENLKFLRDETGVHVHADLIVGLPGEDVASFAAGFDRLVAMRPQEIQVGILKRLRGTPIVRHDAEWGMLYSPNPPFEVLRTSVIDFPTMQRMRRFARYWDLVANSGNFVETTPELWSSGASPFERFMQLSDWLFTTTGQTHALSLTRLAELLFRFFTEVLDRPAHDSAQFIWSDYQRGGRSDRPSFLREYVEPADTRVTKRGPTARAERQARHVGR